MSGINGLVWVFSVVLAVVFILAGLVKAYRYEEAKKRLRWVDGLSKEFVRLIGLVEAVCGAGLILPVATGFYPWLTPVAASMLALIQVAAIGFNARRKDRDEIALNVTLLVLILVVLYGRVGLIAPR